MGRAPGRYSILSRYGKKCSLFGPPQAEDILAVSDGFNANLCVHRALYTYQRRAQIVAIHVASTAHGRRGVWDARV